ncbi:MAG: HEPN domain-containing protein [Candidatus Abyssobacteria bacterium SURF_5]|uniref:HEPN domain-containing protein n=1 Tax=Abyssobacteria bacterium (strain SURF_5) TaxID=2093360 RepID=A0A3A4NYK3_ABYX5|nr:MAG: HEPN domain-containing protein [Candidatus Abyssubacteria bacterium SURF_5]
MKPPEQAKRQLVKQWLAKAEEDFGLAEHLLSEHSPYLGAVGFHSQQAAEKYLKAFLVYHQIDFPKTHDLVEILDLLEPVAPALAQSLQDIRALNPYGVEIRYPGDIPELSANEAHLAVELAGKVRKEILATIKGQT